MKKTTTAVVATIAALALGSSALATMQLQKEYKAKDPKANCASCHTEKMPKKDKADLKGAFTLDREFQATSDRAGADRLYAGWSRAVDRARDWAEHE